jgi:hypothetical protein
MGVPCPPKVQIFVWRLITNGLATWANKLKRKITTTDTCIFCGMEREDTFHVFCRCPMARNLGEAMREVWPLPLLEDIKNTGREWPLHALLQSTDQV